MRTRASVLLAAVCLSACGLLAPKFEKPTLSVVDLRLLGGNFMQQSFLATFKIQNPNDRALPVKGLRAELTVGGERIATGVSNSAFVVPAQGDGQFEMTITANMAAGIFKLLKNVDRRTETIDYELTGAARIDLPFLGDLPFHQNGSIPLQGMLSTR